MNIEDEQVPEETGQPPVSEDSASAPAEDSDLEERLAEAEREKDQFKKLAQRAQADLVNYRNRVRSEQEALQTRTVERVALRFVELADQLEKALSAEVTSGIEQQWVSGVEGIYQNLLNVLKAEGFERFDASDEDFDPRKHDALLATPTPDIAPNRIIRQLAAGYMRHGEVVRPAQVEIASAPDQTEHEVEGQQE